MINYIKALLIALKAHKGQKDKGGKRYFFHPFRVARGVEGKKVKVVALLHDVFEDSDINISDLRFLSSEQREALRVLTHQQSDDYMDYIQKVKQNEIARQVKISDLKDNMNLQRLRAITEKDLRRVEKYRKAMNILRN